MGPTPMYHPPKGEGCETLVEHGLPLWAEPNRGYCSRRPSPSPTHLGFYGVQKSQNQLQSEILLFLSNYTIKRIFSGVTPPPHPPNWKSSDPEIDNAGLSPFKIGRIREI